MAENAIASLDAPLSAASRAAIRTSYAAGESDPLGDGDQSAIGACGGERGCREAQPLREAWSTGMDIFEAVRHPGNDFHMACFTADVATVRRLISKCASPDSDESLDHLLESRVSLMRLTYVTTRRVLYSVPFHHTSHKVAPSDV